MINFVTVYDKSTHTIVNLVSVSDPRDLYQHKYGASKRKEGAKKEAELRKGKIMMDAFEIVDN